MLKAVIFDLDQTLLDRTATFKLFLENQYSRFHGELGALSIGDYVTCVQSHDDNGYVPKDEVYARVCSTWPLNLKESLFTDFIENYGQEPVLFAGVTAVLETLSEKHKLGLITNGRTKGQSAKLDKANLRKYFSAVSISEEVGVKKPNPAIFKHCLRHLDVSPAQAVYVGDHPEKDVLAAQQIGLKGIWVRNQHYSAPETADGIIDELSELLNLLPLLRFD